MAMYLSASFTSSSRHNLGRLAFHISSAIFFHRDFQSEAFPSSHLALAPSSQVTLLSFSHTVVVTSSIYFLLSFCHSGYSRLKSESSTILQRESFRAGNIA